MPNPTCRALIVDDEDIVRRLTVRAIKRTGIECDQARDGQEAAALASTNAYDVVITDLKMPNRNGHAFALELLKLPCPPEIVVLTGITEPKIIKDLQTRGVSEIAFKPVEFPDFAAKVKQLAAKHVADKACVAARTPAAAASTTSAKDSITPEPSAAIAQPSGGLNARHIVLVHLNDPETAHQLVDALASPNVDVVVAATSEEMHEFVNHQRVDLVIIENELKGFLTGLEILQRLFDELLRPDAVIIAEPTDELMKQAAAMDIDQVVGLESGLEPVVKAAECVLSVLNQPNELIPRAARRLVQHYECLPPMPQLLVQLLDYMRMEATEVPLGELATDISTDSQATAELLRLINSSSAGLQRKINSVSEAVNYLGAKRAISLIFASATVRAQTDLLNDWDDALRKWYHQRSVLIASTAAAFAAQLENVSEDTAFVLGLLQEMGVLILANRYQKRYRDRVLNRTRQVPQVLLHASEEEEFQITHAEVSAALLQRWELPSTLIGPILGHHAKDRPRDRSKTELALMRCMQVGEAFANFSDNSHIYRSRKLNDLLAVYGMSKSAQCKACLADATTRTQESCELFAVPPPDPATMKQIVTEVTSSPDFCGLPNS